MGAYTPLIVFTHTCTMFYNFMNFWIYFCITNNPKGLILTLFLFLFRLLTILKAWLFDPLRTHKSLCLDCFLIPSLETKILKHKLMMRLGDWMVFHLTITPYLYFSWLSNLTHPYNFSLQELEGGGISHP